LDADLDLGQERAAQRSDPAIREGRLQDLMLRARGRAPERGFWGWTCNGLPGPRRADGSLRYLVIRPAWTILSSIWREDCAQPGMLLSRPGELLAQFKAGFQGVRFNETNQ
jgi:hypothetical protein